LNRIIRFPVYGRERNKDRRKSFIGIRRGIPVDITEAIKGRRSVRLFTDEKINKDTLEKLVQAGCWAPSGSNAQAWAFVVLTDEKVIKKVLRFSPGLFQVPPAMIFICTDRERAFQKGGELGRDVMCLLDTAMAAENIMLQAYAMGLGTCVLKGFDQKAVQILLNLPDHIVPELLIILGVPKSVPKAPKRRPLEEVLYWEGWDSSDREE
jgi:nitroreductase